MNDNVNSSEQIILDEIENESESVGRIDIEELRNDPEIIKKKVDEKIKAILDKYGFAFAITEFSWINGQVQGNLDLVDKPKDIIEQ